MAPRIRADDATDKLLARYVTGIDALHGKLARIATQHREIIAAVHRMTTALRTIEQAGRR